MAFTDPSTWAWRQCVPVKYWDAMKRAYDREGIRYELVDNRAKNQLSYFVYPFWPNDEGKIMTVTDEVYREVDRAK
jgi:hypothetical protein